jgi:hypothetical protein
MTTRRWAPAPIAVAVATITAVRITFTIPVVAGIAPTAVTITAVPKVPVTGISAVPTIVRIAVGGPAVSHVFTRGWGMRPVSHGIIDTDAAAVQILGIQIRSRKIKTSNKLRGFFDRAHSDKTEATRPIGLLWSQIGVRSITEHRVKHTLWS